MIAGAPEAVRDLFSKRVKLMSPLMKDWKAALKAENAVDFSGLIHQAVNILDKGRFVSPWKHILVDEFQDISPQRASLLAALRRQNSQTTLFAVGDDWQAIYRFSGAQLSLTTAFNHYFGEGDCCALDTTYRFNGRIGEIANGFIQQNPHQLSKPLNSLTAGDKKAVTLLADDKLDDLLDKLSGYVKPEQRILLLARYHHLKPEALNKAATRWPHLQLDFMTIHASKGQQADFVIVLGLQDGEDAFPAPARESIMEQALLPQPEDFPDAEERRLLYVALTRARHRVWLLFNKAQPSPFVEILQALDVPVAEAVIAARLFQALGKIAWIIRDQNIERLTEVRRLDNKVSGGDVSGDRNIPDGGRRSNALTSGSWGTAFSGSQKKISTSILPSEMRAPTCWSPPIGPLSMALTSRPVARETRLPVVPVAYKICCASSA